MKKIEVKIKLGKQELDKKLGDLKGIQSYSVLQGEVASARMALLLCFRILTRQACYIQQDEREGRTWRRKTLEVWGNGPGME